MRKPLVLDKATLVYDGACGLCRSAAARVSLWDREHRVRLVPFQEVDAVAPLRIDAPALAAAIHLVLPDGQVFTGADSIPELLRLLPGKRWLAPCFGIPGARFLARRAYRYVAKRRSCIPPVRGLPSDGAVG